MRSGEEEAIMPRAKHLLGNVEGTLTTPSDGFETRHPRANAKELRKISPVGRNDNARLAQPSDWADRSFWRVLTRRMILRSLRRVSLSGDNPGGSVLFGEESRDRCNRLSF